MLNKKPVEVYSTGQAAKLIGCSTHTVHKYIDSGRLNGFRIPGSKFRKVPRQSLIDFLTNAGIEVPAELIRDPEPPPGTSRTERNKAADEAWRRIAHNPYAMLGKPCDKAKAIRTLSWNLQALTILTPLQRIGYVQAAADLVADFERIEKERASKKCQPS